MSHSHLDSGLQSDVQHLDSKGFSTVLVTNIFVWVTAGEKCHIIPSFISNPVPHLLHTFFHRMHVTAWFLVTHGIGPYFLMSLTSYYCLVPIPRKLNNSWMAADLPHLVSKIKHLFLCICFLRLISLFTRLKRSYQSNG